MIGKAGGIEQIIDAMDTHVNNSSVQNMACGVLGTLAMNPRYSEKIAKAGGIERIVKAIALIIESEFQRLAYCALLSIRVAEYFE